jgi:hypothetical protein
MCHKPLALRTLFNEHNVLLNKTAPLTNEINVFVNNSAIVFPDQQPIILNGRVLVPVRFVTEKLNCSVEWEDSSQTVHINKHHDA